MHLKDTFVSAYGRRRCPRLWNISKKLSNYWYLLLMVEGLLYNFFMFSFCMSVISWGLFCSIQYYSFNFAALLYLITYYDFVLIKFEFINISSFGIRYSVFGAPPSPNPPPKGREGKGRQGREGKGRQGRLRDA